MRVWDIDTDTDFSGNLLNEKLYKAIYWWHFTQNFNVSKTTAY